MTQAEVEWRHYLRYRDAAEFARIVNAVAVVDKVGVMWIGSGGVLLGAVGDVATAFGHISRTAFDYVDVFGVYHVDLGRLAEGIGGVSGPVELMEFVPTQATGWREFTSRFGGVLAAAGDRRVEVGRPDLRFERLMSRASFAAYFTKEVDSIKLDVKKAMRLAENRQSVRAVELLSGSKRIFKGTTLLNILTVSYDAKLLGHILDAASPLVDKCEFVILDSGMLKAECRKKHVELQYFVKPQSPSDTQRKDIHAVRREDVLVRILDRLNSET
ncbi:MAG: hypothetical protein ACK4SY_10485 [Pyrobaculum sp.]